MLLCCQWCNSGLVAIVVYSVEFMISSKEVEIEVLTLL